MEFFVLTDVQQDAKKNDTTLTNKSTGHGHGDHFAMASNSASFRSDVTDVEEDRAVVHASEDRLSEVREAPF